MKNTRSLVLGFSLSAFLWACAGQAPAPAEPAAEPAKKPTAPAPQEPSGALPLLDEKEPDAAQLASPVSGPAQEDLPPAPPRIIDRDRVDLLSLTEAPQLVIDAAGHSSKVRSLLYTHDGRSLVSAGYDKTVRVWSAQTGELERTIRGDIGEGPAGRIYATSLSKDDRWLAVGGWLGKKNAPSRYSGSDAFKIRLLNFHSGTSHQLLSGHNDVVLSLAFSSKGQKLISGGGDHRAYIWDASTGRRDHSLQGHEKGVTAVAWSPDDALVATGSIDKSARIWDTHTGSMLFTLSGHGDTVQSLAFTPSGRSLVTGSRDGTIRIWDAKNGAMLKILADLRAPIASVALTPDGMKVLATTSGGDFTSHVLSINDGKPVSKHQGHDNVVLSSAISPNGKWAATSGGSDFGISVWDIKSGKEQIHAAGHGATVWSVGFRNDGTSIAWGHDFDQKALSQYQLNGPLKHELPLARPGIPLRVIDSVSHQGDYIRARENEGGLSLKTPTGKEHEELQVWASGRKLSSIRRDVTSGFVHRSFSLSPNANVVVSGGDNGVLTSYSARSGYKLRDFKGHTGDILALAISNDGQRVVSGSSDQTVRLWDLESGKLLLTVFRARNREWVAFTPSGYYTSSPYGDSYVGWHANRGPRTKAAYFPASALSSQLRYEVVVRQYLLLNGNIVAAVAACNKTLAAGHPKIHYYRFEDLPQFAPPEIYYLDPGSDLRTKEDRIKVTARAYSPTTESIESMKFLINGRPIDERWMRKVGRPYLSKSGRTATLTATIPLPQKVNRISVVASNRYNQSEPITFEVERTGGPGKLEKIYQPDLYMLSVGISKYGFPGLDSLAYAHKDAEAISAAFTKKNRKLYGSVNVRTYTDRRATKSTIEYGLRWLSRNAQQKDVVLLFLSGYSAREDNGEFYFLPHDASLNRLKETAISWKDLKTTLAKVPAKVVIMLDSSNGGTLPKNSKKVRDLIDLNHLLRSNLSTESGMIVMTSSTGVEQSFESATWKHGAFTKALLDGLNGRADYDRDRSIFIRELDHYVSHTVPRLTDGRQHPTTEIPRSMPNFSLSDR